MIVRPPHCVLQQLSLSRGGGGGGGGGGGCCCCCCCLLWQSVGRSIVVEEAAVWLACKLLGFSFSAYRFTLCKDATTTATTTTTTPDCVTCTSRPTMLAELPIPLT